MSSMVAVTYKWHLLVAEARQSYLGMFDVNIPANNLKINTCLFFFSFSFRLYIPPPDGSTLYEIKRRITAVNETE